MVLGLFALLLPQMAVRSHVLATGNQRRVIWGRHWPGVGTVLTSLSFFLDRGSGQAAALIGTRRWARACGARSAW